MKNTPEIIYEDNHIIVCIKPANVLSQADNTKDPDMLTIIKEYLKEKYDKPGNVYLGLLHRLDRTAAGVMVFAKTSKAASRISEQINKRNGFKKNYLAVIHGIPIEDTAVFRDFLQKDTDTNTVSVVNQTGGEYKNNAREAVLEYKTIGSVNYGNQDLTLVLIDLITGRPHQIRVQFASRGMPLYGDSKYGGSKYDAPKYSKYGGPKHGQNKNMQLSLWSKSVELIHPVSKEKMIFSRDPPLTFPWNLFETYSGFFP